VSRLNARWAVGVVIPARNEDATIAASVASTRAALASCTQLLDAWIVVVCDTCADETASHARQALEDAGEIIECSAGTVGQARAIGVDAVSMRFQRFSPDRVWIANTDADTTVPPDWIARQLPFADKGWAAIAGIVRVDSIEGDYGTIEEVFADYAVGDDGSHYHVHGANLGVRADAYESVGAWRHVALAEDHCLWSRLKAGKWPILSTSDVVVTTSGRLTGRAVGGFADTLRAKIASLVAKPRESACEKLEGMRVSPETQ
jgi:cellulose synthase/poly-beta-1,6-N-acetylglucosamine synthase-like glycosyltransferase